MTKAYQTKRKEIFARRFSIEAELSFSKFNVSKLAIFQRKPRVSACRTVGRSISTGVVYFPKMASSHFTTGYIYTTMQQGSSRLALVGASVNVNDLVVAFKIAQRLEFARPQVVHEWRRRHRDLPDPIAALNEALIWDWKEVE